MRQAIAVFLSLVLVSSAATAEKTARGSAKSSAKKPAPAAVKKAPAEKKTAIVDAASDGGMWWHPQTQGSDEQRANIDPKKPHQGTYLRDFLQSENYAVTELAPGTSLEGKFEKADLVIRIAIPRPEFTKDDIAAAYEQYLEKGGRVLIFTAALRDQDNQEPIQFLGLTFDYGPHPSHEVRWAKLPETRTLTQLPYTYGIKVASVPENTKVLGTVGEDKSPAVAVYPWKKGKVAFVGTREGMAAFWPERKDIIKVLLNALK